MVWVKNTDTYSSIEPAREYLSEILQKAHRQNKVINENAIYEQLQQKFGLFEDTIANLLASLTKDGKARLDLWHTSTLVFQPVCRHLIRKINYDEA